MHLLTAFLLNRLSRPLSRRAAPLAAAAGVAPPTNRPRTNSTQPPPPEEEEEEMRECAGRRRGGRCGGERQVKTKCCELANRVENTHSGPSAIMAPAGKLGIYVYFSRSNSVRASYKLGDLFTTSARLAAAEKSRGGGSTARLARTATQVSMGSNVSNPINQLSSFPPF